jgi:hypothetical protein
LQLLFISLARRPSRLAPRSRANACRHTDSGASSAQTAEAGRPAQASIDFRVRSTLRCQSQSAPEHDLCELCAIRRTTGWGIDHFCSFTEMDRPGPG